MYIRMTFRAVEVYDLLEPLLKDFRKLRMRSMGTHSSHTDVYDDGNDSISGVYANIHGRICG